MVAYVHRALKDVKAIHSICMETRVEPRANARPFAYGAKGWAFLYFYRRSVWIMADIDIIFPDGTNKLFPKGTTGESIASSISPGLKKKALAIKMDGILYDLRRPLEYGGKLEILTYKNTEGLEVARHSTAHLMAQAI